jgi:hypothetical protein
MAPLAKSSDSWELATSFWRVITPGSTIAKQLKLYAGTLRQLPANDVGH